MIDWYWHFLVSLHPIRKLLVSINQSSYLIYFCYSFLTVPMNKNLYEIKSRSLRSQIFICFVFLVFFSKKITVLFNRITLQKDFVKFDEELDGIDTGDIGNLEDSPEICVHQWGMWEYHIREWWIAGELTQSINQKKKFGVF